MPTPASLRGNRLYWVLSPLLATNEQTQTHCVEHDDHHASHIGSLPDGRQFFLTTPFVPAMGTEPGREFVAVFLFDKRGRFLEARIDDLGTRAELEEGRARRTLSGDSQSLGQSNMAGLRCSHLRSSGSAQRSASFRVHPKRTTTSGP